MERKEEVARFVREVLGCGCPEHLFRRLLWEKGEGPLSRALTRAGAEPAELGMVISLGGRLLAVVTACQEDKRLERLLEAGVAVRDRTGHHRFRLAVAGPLPAGAADSLMAGSDERTHLHVLAAEELPRGMNDEGGERGDGS